MNRSRVVLDLVLPIYNEAHVLERSVSQLEAAMARYALPPWRIVVVDNGSTDASREVGERLARRDPAVVYRRLEQKGRGLALRTIWNETAARYSLYMDIDLSTDLEAVPEAVRRLENGADIVTGSRLAAGSQIRRCLKRETLSRGYNALIGAMFRRRGYDDAQCGFKGVRVARVRQVLPWVRNDHWFFDTELLVVAEAVGYEVGSFPVRWVEDSDTRVKIASTVWEDLKGLARVRSTLADTVREWERLHTCVA